MSLDAEVLLFDEEPDFLMLDKDEQKRVLKETVSKFTRQQKSERIKLKIESHKNVMRGGLPPSSGPPMARKKSTPAPPKKTAPKKAPKKVPKKAPKKASAPSAPAAPASKKIEDGDINNKIGKIASKSTNVDGNSTRKRTKKNILNYDLLDFLEKTDSKEGEIAQLENKKEEPNKNVMLQKNDDEDVVDLAHIRRSNRKLESTMKDITDDSLPKGYSVVRKGQDPSLFVRDNKNTSIDEDIFYSFDRNVPMGRQQRMNPSLQTNVANNSLGLNFRRLGGLNTDNNTVNFNRNQIVTVLKWHEQRINDYKNVIKTNGENIVLLNKKINKLVTYIDKKFNEPDYVDFSTIKSWNINSRKIQSTWRNHIFKKSVAAIKIQRWFRYKKNVEVVVDEVQEFLQELMQIRSEASQITTYLKGFDSKKALPLDKLRKIKKRMKERQTMI